MMIHDYRKNHINFSAKALFVASFVAAARLSVGGAAAQPTETALYSFCTLASCADGLNPTGSLAALGNGNLYGTTEIGGTMDSGTVCQLSGTGFVP